MQETSTLSLDKGVRTLTLHSDDGLNMLSDQMIRHIESNLSDLESDRSVRCLMITGEKRVFSAGADLRSVSQMTPVTVREFIERGQMLCSHIESLPFPTIAALNGAALGGGCELALSCTFRFASEKTIIGLPEVKLGILPGFGGTQRLPRLIGFRAARRLILSGAQLTAREACVIGLIDEVTDHDNLMTSSASFANELATGSRSAASAVLTALYASRDVSFEEGLRREADLFAEAFQSSDRVEGIEAFLSKRKPRFDAG